MEKIVEIKTCKYCSCQFEITDKDLEFYDKVSPVFEIPHPNPLLTGEGKIKDLGNNKYKYLIPTPTLCPDCRQQRRLSFRNERKLYKRKCDLTGKEIISIYSPDKPYKVYDQKEWWSDKWDAMDYGRDFDFGRGFFEQFDELQNKVPLCSRIINSSEGCDYCNESGFLKNCYLTFSAGYNENTFYSSGIVNSINCLDCFFVTNLKYCYECIDCKDSYNLEFSISSQNCSDSFFLYNCKNCENCFMCTNLLNGKYYINNKKYSEEEYNEYIKGFLDFSNLLKYKNDFKNLLRNIIHHSNIINSENSSGDQINSSKNVLYSFDINNSENLKYVFFAYNCLNSYDIYTHGDNAELMYESMGVGSNAYNILFSHHCYDNIKNIYYSTNCVSGSNNLFGCTGLKNKQYCILNKQYEKEEYEELVVRIIKHMTSPQPSPLGGEGVTPEWGEFFPSWMSPFGYNETVAMEYYPIPHPIPQKQPHPDPLLRGEGERFNWSTYESPFPKVEKIIPASKLPDSIADIPDDILNWAIECEVTKKPFRIIAQELEFYRKHNLPIPRRHPDQRHLDRMLLRNPRKLFDRKCDKCGKDMKTTYNPERKEIVYCEECYNKEVY